MSEEEQIALMIEVANHNEKVTQIEQTENLERCTFFPFSDMKIEVYPGNHPFIEDSYAIRPTQINTIEDTKNIQGFDNPWREEPALLAFGRACQRYLLTPEDIDSLISFLENAKNILNNVATGKEEVVDVPLKLDQDQFAFAKPDLKRLSGDSEAGEFIN